MTENQAEAIIELLKSIDNNITNLYNKINSVLPADTEENEDDDD